MGKKRYLAIAALAAFVAAFFTIFLSFFQELSLKPGESMTLVFDIGGATADTVRNVQIKIDAEGDVLYSLLVRVEGAPPSVAALEIYEDDSLIEVLNLAHENVWAVSKYLSGESHKITLRCLDTSGNPVLENYQTLTWVDKSWELTVDFSGWQVVSRERPITDRGELVSPYSIALQLPLGGVVMPPAELTYDDFDHFDSSKWIIKNGQIEIENGCMVLKSTNYTDVYSRESFGYPTIETKMKLETTDNGAVGWLMLQVESGVYIMLIKDEISGRVDAWVFGDGFGFRSERFPCEYLYEWHDIKLVLAENTVWFFLDNNYFFSRPHTRPYSYQIRFSGWRFPVLGYVDYLKFGTSSQPVGFISVPLTEENLSLQGNRWHLTYNCVLKTSTDVDNVHTFYLTGEQWRNLLEMHSITLVNGSQRSVKLNLVEIKVVYANKEKVTRYD
jgi:hypothetical protein